MGKLLVGNIVHFVSELGLMPAIVTRVVDDETQSVNLIVFRDGDAFRGQVPVCQQRLGVPYNETFLPNTYHCADQEEPIVAEPEGPSIGIGGGGGVAIGGGLGENGVPTGPPPADPHLEIPLYDPDEPVDLTVKSNPAVGEITKNDPLTSEHMPGFPAGYTPMRDGKHFYAFQIPTAKLVRFHEVADPLGDYPGYLFPDPDVYEWAVRRR